MRTFEVHTFAKQRPVFRRATSLAAFGGNVGFVIISECFFLSFSTHYKIQIILERKYAPVPDSHTVKNNVRVTYETKAVGFLLG